MFEWMAANGWMIWLILVAVLVIVEIITLDLMFLMLAIGALAATGVSALSGGQPVLEIIVFAVISVLLLLVARPRLLATVQRGPGKEGLSNADRLPGEQATVLETVTEATGLVRLQGDVWTARSTGEAFQLGDRVYVQRVDGATVVVDRTEPETQNPAV